MAHFGVLAVGRAVARLADCRALRQVPVGARHDTSRRTSLPRRPRLRGAGVARRQRLLRAAPI